ncbi:unnamed protein product [Psylliodes chrysocephalus]|uniref:Uncharacterized protein n=1 Tax=Psylliodes chrysocephalus TaxID=3402493 RepID=A0A9P0CLC8_9CUCU|nr:unnamed protein product [Psylliodes chrysocephala]
MIGILNGNLAIWVIFVVCYTLLVVGLSFKIYFLNYVIDGLEQFKNCINDHGFCFESLKPIRKTRFVLLLIANIANYSMLIIGLWLYNENVTDFGTFLLALLMGNGVIHAIFYTCMKVTPAESRQWNQECLLLKFFDKHDVWHLLSAPALYFTFMYLMSLDDDIMDKEQTEIPVF